MICFFPVKYSIVVWNQPGFIFLRLGVIFGYLERVINVYGLKFYAPR